MSWFGFSDIAKNAISEAQKKIDKVLDIQQEDEETSHRNAGIDFTPNDNTSVIKHETHDKHSQFKEISPRIIKTANFSSSSKRNKKNSKLGTRLTKPTLPTVVGAPTSSASDDTFEKASNDSNFSDQVLEVPDEQTGDASQNVALTTGDNKPDSSEEKQDKIEMDNSVTKEADSPINLTPESSEIDVLDNDSIVSEVSSVQSKLTDNEVQIQSPASAVSSHINVLSDIELLPSSGYSSPPTAYGDEVQSFNEKMKEYIKQSENVEPLQGHDENSPEMQADAEEPAVNSEQMEQNSDTETRLNVENQSDEPIKEQENNVEKENTIDLLNEKIASYEKKLFNLSNLNAKLCEDNDNFLSEIQMLKENQYNESESTIQELERSLFNMENKYNLICEEKANLKKQKDILEGNLAARMTHEQVQQVLSEKEESIRGLLEEGEKLSKQHLQQSNLIKKLKSQLTEKENTLKSTKSKYESTLNDKENLQIELAAVKNSDEEYKSTSIRISQAYKEKEDEIIQLKENLILYEEKEISLKNNLDSAYLKITELNKCLAQKESSLNSEWENKEHELKQQSDVEIRKLKMEFDHQKEILLIQIMDLNNSIQKNEIVYSRKNDELRSEIKDLQDRLQQAEIRNQELMEGVSIASAPLLRQLENLQTTSASQQRSWMALEKNLNGRLEETQTQLTLALDKERSAQNNLVDFKAKFKSLEQQLLTEIENNKETKLLNHKLKLENENINEKSLSSMKELETLHRRHSDSIETLKKEKLALENQLNMEKVRFEAEQKKFKVQQEAWKKEREKLTWYNRNEVSSVSVPDAESVCSGKDSGHMIENSSFEQGLSFASSSFTASHSYNDIRMSGSTTAFENLQSQVKRNEGEIAQLHGEINRLERTRASMAEEIVRLTNENEDLEVAFKDLEMVRAKLAETETRYNTILGLYGEKEEENEELRMDLEDVKSMYKQQINELLKPLS